MRTLNSFREPALTVVFLALCLIPFETGESNSILVAGEGAPNLPPRERVRLNEKVIAGVRAKFSKLGADSKSPRFNFIVLGDPQGNYDCTQKLLDQAMSSKPAFAVCLGDLTERGTEAEYQKYVDLVARNWERIPIVSIIGNHDILNDGRSRYLSYFGKSDFSFDLPGARFICLDNSGDKLAPRQIEWLESMLETAKGKRKFIFLHEPPYMGNWWFRAFTKGTNEFLTLVEKYKVACVFAGHVHIYDKVERNGVKYVVAGSGGVPPANLPIGDPIRCYVGVEASKSGEKTTVHKLAVKESKGAKEASSLLRLSTRQD